MSNDVLTAIARVLHARTMTYTAPAVTTLYTYSSQMFTGVKSAARLMDTTNINRLQQRYSIMRIPNK